MRYSRSLVVGTLVALVVVALSVTGAFAGMGGGILGGNPGGMMGGGANGNSGGMMGGGANGYTGGMMGGATNGYTGGMMGGGMMGGGMMGGGMMGWTTATGKALTMDQALAAVTTELKQDGLTNLKPDEIMEFANNFYVPLKEKDTGRFAMELLVDRFNGAVSPEMGPNMMWNRKYGMMGTGMMGGGTDTAATMSVSPAQAVQKAQAWLDRAYPGVTAPGSTMVDQFPGYYTIDISKNGQTWGMLSVNGSTGAVWYHAWHGPFLAQREL